MIEKINIKQLEKNSCCSIPSLNNIRISIITSICIGCGVCAEVCPFGLPQKKANNKYRISDPALCTECSACKRNCPVGAISMFEQKGCGCLWDARQRITKKNGSCCS
jgi:ferredoxin